MTHPTRALIDLAALRHNHSRARHSAPHSRTLAVVKANAYGHGLMTVAKALQGRADGLALTYTEEAAHLRSAGVDMPIVLLQGFADGTDLRRVCELGLDTVVHHQEQVRALQVERLERPVRVWLKVDTGMHRLGFTPERAAKVYQCLQDCPSVAAPLRLMTHLANAEDQTDSTTQEQLRRFREVTRRFEAQHSIANSAGVLGWPDSHAEWNRPGVMLYGSSPFVSGSGVDLDLRPVMTLSSRLVAINQQRRGARLGYGGLWSCPQDMPVGVVAAGYGDGYPRHAASGTPVLVKGRRVPLVGRVSMDMITLDLRTCPEAQVGDPVVLWGRGLPVEEVARSAGTISYELLAQVTRRVVYCVEAEDDGQD